MVIGGLLLCKRCDIAQPTSGFRVNRRMRSGFNSWCKTCCLESTRKWRAEHPEYEESHAEARRLERSPEDPRGVRAAGRDAVCAVCGEMFRARSGAALVCSRLCKSRRQETLNDPVKRKAHYIAKNGRRRSAERSGDLKAADVLALYAFVKRCPLCGVRLNEKPNHPRRKHLDHIVPLNAGGRHTLTNVRVVCQTCNLGRPKDGSDLSQLVLA